MATRLSLRACTGVLCLVLASLPACGKHSNPVAPSADPNAALYGTWVGTLAGPDTTQHSGWSAASRDSIWVVLRGTSMKYYMSPTKGSAPSLSRSPDTCF